MTAKVPVCLAVNGTAYHIEVEPRLTLADAIRQDCGLTGTHIGCEHGICGACTVIVDGEAVRSCLMFAVQAEGCAIRTVEGLASMGPTPSWPAGAGARHPSPNPLPQGEGALVRDSPSPCGRGAGGGVSGRSVGPPVSDLHALQAAFMQHHGLQCGFCTPGFLMLATAALERDPHISDTALLDTLSANLCRCTGYQGIIDAVLSAARVMRAEPER